MKPATSSPADVETLLLEKWGKATYPAGGLSFRKHLQSILSRLEKRLKALEEKEFLRSSLETVVPYYAIVPTERPTSRPTGSTTETEATVIRSVFVMVEGRPQAVFYGHEGFQRAVWCCRQGAFGGAWSIVDEEDAILDSALKAKCKSAGVQMIKAPSSGAIIGAVCYGGGGSGGSRPSSEYIAKDPYPADYDAAGGEASWADKESDTFDTSEKVEGSWRSRPPLL